MTTESDKPRIKRNVFCVYWNKEVPGFGEVIGNSVYLF